MGWWSARPYALDVAAQFLPAVSVAWLLVGLGLLAGRRWRIAGMFLASAAALVAACRTGVRGPTGGEPAPGSVLVRIVHFNAYGEHSRNDNDFIAWLRAQDPDIIVINDAPWEWRREYPWLVRAYPTFVQREPGLEWPVVVMSRFPGEITPLAPYSERVVFSFVARRSLTLTLPNGTKVLLTTMHPPSPRTSDSWRSALRYVERDGVLLREWTAITGVRAIVPGDFNSSPQGRSHRAFARSSGMTAWVPWLVGGTWHSSWPRWASLPLDKVWTSPGLVVRRLEIGPAFRSDHRPFVCEVEVPAPLAAPGQGLPLGAEPRDPAGDVPDGREHPPADAR